MTAPDAMSDGLAAALIQISAHAERISSLDVREADHFEQVVAHLRDLASEITTSQSRHPGGGNSAGPNERQRWTGSAHGSSRSTGPATVSLPSPCRRAGNAT